MSARASGFPDMRNMAYTFANGMERLLAYVSAGSQKPVELAWRVQSVLP